jgi:16S rRNA (cytidine1402-2'-O)-methyltransferase
MRDDATRARRSGVRARDRNRAKRDASAITGTSTNSDSEAARPGTLYVVATPLGNLEDITLRALRILKGVALIAAEDTRHSRTLLEHFGIATPTTSYHDHNEREKAPHLVERLTQGDSIALISDAGTPGVADPGYRLVTAAIAAGVPVVPVPGPSAVVAALSASGLPTDRFAFEGFVPERSAQRCSFFSDLRGERRTIVCFEAARRIEACLRDLIEVLGDRRIAVGRELTKKFEEMVRGRASAALERFAQTAARGEFTLIIEGGSAAGDELSEAELGERIAAMRRAGMSVREAARAVAEETGRGRNEIYRIALAVAESG